MKSTESNQIRIVEYSVSEILGIIFRGSERSYLVNDNHYETK